MGRKTTWKSICITDGDALRRLESAYGSSVGVLGKYEVDMDMLRSNGFIETNLPWSELRAWFRFADVPFPRDVVTSSQSLDEMYSDL